MSLITSLLGSLWPYLAAGIAGLAVLWRVYAAGQNKQLAKQAAADKKAADTAHRVDQEVDALKPADAREELKKWSRKP